jgi:hypothetical protein
LPKIIGAATALIAAVASLISIIGSKPKEPTVEYSGSISFSGGRPLVSAEIDLIGTPCRARTANSGYFRFANCPQASQLAQARIRIFVPGQEQPCTATLQPAPQASDIDLDPKSCGASVTATAPSASPPVTPPAPPPGQRYLQLASTPTQEEAEALAQRQAGDTKDRICVYASRGKFATAAGPVPAGEADARLEKLRLSSTVATSAYAVLGTTYRPVSKCFP